MPKKKPETQKEEFLRIPKKKSSLGLKISPIEMPHSEFVKAEVLHFPSEHISEVQSEKPIASFDKTAKDISGHPEKIELDTQKNCSGHSEVDNLDTQKKYNRHPENKFLVTQAPRNRTEAPRKETVSGAQAPENKKSGHSKNANWKQYEKKRTTVRVNLHISEEIDRKVRQYCMINAKPKVELKDFYERAALYYLDILDTQNITSLGAEAPLDDRRLKMLYKTKPFIINLYLRYNTIFNEISAASAKTNWSARWTPRDDEAARKYNGTDPRIVELGIIQTQTNKGIGQGRIQTFKYYVDEIENVLLSEVGTEMLDTILQYHRQIWTRWTGREIDLSFLSKEE
jgi:hypothetical protein